MDEYKKAVAEAEEIEHEDWMMRGFTKQAEELGKLMKKYGYLINIKWNESKVLAPA
jgi:hypothetical protein